MGLKIMLVQVDFLEEYFDGQDSDNEYLVCGKYAEFSSSLGLYKERDGAEHFLW